MSAVSQIPGLRGAQSLRLRPTSFASPQSATSVAGTPLPQRHPTPSGEPLPHGWSRPTAAGRLRPNGFHPSAEAGGLPPNGRPATGEAARQLAEGAAFRALALPSAAEVATHLTAFTTARNLAQQAQVKTDREREDVSALYPAAQALAVDLCDTIEFFYRKDPDDASRRAKCKRWGVVYFYEPNEPQDPEPTPTLAPVQR
jgi:hypothetical protein